MPGLIGHPIRGASEQAEGFELAAQHARATGNVCRECRAPLPQRVLGIVVDEHGFVRRDVIAVEQDAEDPRVRLDHAFGAGDHDAVEPGEEREAGALAGNVSADQLVSA